MLRQGTGEALVLLHGIICSERVWSHLIPLLAADHDVIAPTALGHRGGAAAVVRPARLGHIVDDIERVLDELGLEKAHLAGNSMGGFLALELARRGRARSVCALSPAGAWGADTDRHPEQLRAVVRDTRRGRTVLPLLVGSRRFRHWALRYSAVHGERVSGADLLGYADDVIGCAIFNELLDSFPQLAPLDPPPCPITLAWGVGDRLFPVAVNGARAREVIPGADFVLLDDVGHVPMFDDPQLVSDTILASTRK